MKKGKSKKLSIPFSTPFSGFRKQLKALSLKSYFNRHKSLRGKKKEGVVLPPKLSISENQSREIFLQEMIRSLDVALNRFHKKGFIFPEQKERFVKLYLAEDYEKLEKEFLTHKKSEDPELEVVELYTYLDFAYGLAKRAALKRRLVIGQLSDYNQN